MLEGALTNNLAFVHRELSMGINNSICLLQVATLRASRATGWLFQTQLTLFCRNKDRLFYFKVA
jgi:hypothetical protein